MLYKLSIQFPNKSAESRKLTVGYSLASAARAGTYRRHHPPVDYVRAEIFVRRTVGENFRTGLDRCRRP